MITLIRQKTKPYSMELLFKTIGKSRQHYWQLMSGKKRKEYFEDEIINIVSKWRKNHSKVGSRPLFHMIEDSGVELGVGVNKFEQILRENHLTIGKIKSKMPRTSDGKGWNNYPNLTNGLQLNDINQLIVSDITYYSIQGDWHYIFTLKDVYSQRVLGLVASRSMKYENALNCIEQMIKLRGKKNLKGCIHHTDNGSQYNALAYVARLKECKIKISRASSCQENGSSEQLNHIIKNMYFVGWKIDTFEDLQKACKKFMFLNNHERAIKQLGYLSPVKFEEKIRMQKIEDRRIKTLYDFEK